MVKSNQITLEELNKNWFGFIIIQTFEIDLRTLIRHKILISREYHISPSEIDRMQYWEYEWYCDNIQEIVKEQELQQKEQEKQQHQMTSSMNPNSMMRNISNSIPKMPSMTMPNISMPHF